MSTQIELEAEAIWFCLFTNEITISELNLNQWCEDESRTGKPPYHVVLAHGKEIRAYVSGSTVKTFKLSQVATARPQTNAHKSVKEWRSIFDSTLQNIAQKTACPPLDEVSSKLFQCHQAYYLDFQIESLAASIIIIGSEHQSLFVVAFHLLL